MADVFEVTIWARGVTQDMEGRHLSLVIANAAAKDGKFTQAWDNYADLPDRVQVPLRKYARISDEEMRDLRAAPNKALPKWNYTLRPA